MTLRIGIAGIRGRMGREIAAQAANDQRMTLIGGLSRQAGTVESGPDGVRLFVDIADLLPEIDVLIDFSAPAGTVDHAPRARRPACRWSAGRPGSTAPRWQPCVRRQSESRSSTRRT